MVERKTVNKRIEELRKERNLSQEQFAVKLGFDDAKRGRSTVNNWEQGAVQVKSDDLIRIGSAFGVSADWLLGLTEHPSVNENMQIAIKTTGLSEKAIQNLQELSEDDILAPITDKFLASDLYKNDFIFALSNAFVAVTGAKMEISQIDTLSRTDAYSCVYRLMKELKYSVFEVSESATRLITSLAGIEEEKQKLKEKEAALDDALEDAIRRYENGERS